MKLKAVVTQEFPGRPDHDSLPRTIKVGEEITGELAQVAIDNKWAKEVAVSAPRPRTVRKAKPVAKAKPARKR